MREIYCAGSGIGKKECGIAATGCNLYFCAVNMFQMQFTTPVNVSQPPFGLGFRDRLLLMGSCFSSEIGQRMTDGGLDALVNPFGILYNPVSI